MNIEAVASHLNSLKAIDQTDPPDILYQTEHDTVACLRPRKMADLEQL